VLLVVFFTVGVAFVAYWRVGFSWYSCSLCSLWR